MIVATLSLLALVALSGCGVGDDAPGEQVSVRGGSFTRVTPSELADMLKSKDFPFINVHIPYEGDIAETDLSIPFDQISTQLDKLPSDKSARIVLYCRSGRMSTEAATELVGLGYTNVWELGGGMQAWESAGFELLQIPQ